MRYTPREQRIADLAAPVIQEQGFALVCVRITTEGNDQIVRIMAEDPQTRKIGLDDCAKISRQISALFDVEDPVQGTYRLEVGSPGIDRPLMTMQDFVDFAGHEAKIELVAPDENGQKKFRGFIKGPQPENKIEIETDSGSCLIDFDMIGKARLVLTDELIKQKAKAKG